MGGIPQLDPLPEPDFGAGFLGLPLQCAGPESRVWVLPVPYEATTTYGHGSKSGPDAILQASTQVEYYDRELGCEPAHAYGIHTLAPLGLEGISPAGAIDAIADCIAWHYDPSRQICALGGEHGMSIGVARGLRQVVPDYVTVQLDAHADLRDTYDGTPLSHACVARRIVDLGSPLFQLGIRSLDITEAAFIAANTATVTSIDVETMRGSQDWQGRLAEFVRGRDVYLTIDVDALDPSIIPATGTPEPDGLTWRETLDILRIVAGIGRVIAFDCVELAPVAGLHYADFAAAKLVYKTMNLIMSSPAWKQTWRDGRNS
ncbi:MAG: agmatinase [Capsulimonadaceae bacterium]|nr:agmatinase [Capsulimonadaceae bacterium]